MTGSHLHSVSAFSGVLLSQPPVPWGKGWGYPRTDAPFSPRALAPRDAGSQPGPAALVCGARALACSLSVRASLHLWRLDSSPRTRSCSPTSPERQHGSLQFRAVSAGGGRGPWATRWFVFTCAVSGALHGAALPSELHTRAPRSQTITLKHPLQRRHVPIQRTRPSPLLPQKDSMTCLQPPTPNFPHPTQILSS